MRDTHVADGSEVLFAAVEVGRDRVTVLEVVVVEHVVLTADVEHDRNARFLRRGPDRVEPEVTRRVPLRAGRGNEERRSTHVDGFVRHVAGGIEVGKRHAHRGQESRVCRTELGHAAVVCTRGTGGELGVGVFPVGPWHVEEGVEDELALYADEIDRPNAVGRVEAAGRSEVLARHDLCFFGGAVRRRTRGWLAPRRSRAVCRRRPTRRAVPGVHGTAGRRSH